MINFELPVAYNEKRKASFHLEARKALKRVAAELNLQPGTFELRSNKGGIAVSGEVTLHGERIYIQVSQSCMGPQMGILIRACKGRRDYTGHTNNFLPLSALHQPETIARHARKIIGYMPVDM